MAKSKNPNPARATPKKRPVRLAVLIDTSNVGSPDVLDFVFQTIREREGSAELTCHAFGDFQKHTEWISFCDKYSAKKHQHNEGKYGKNAADIAMVIMAMDIAYGFGRRTGRLVDGFCLVSSDTDFRALALRIRSSGYKVYGFGYRDTPDRLKSVFSDGFFSFPEPEPPDLQFTPCPKTEPTRKENRFDPSGVPSSVQNGKPSVPARQPTVHPNSKPSPIARPSETSSIVRPVDRPFVPARQRAEDFLSKTSPTARPRTMEKLRASVKNHFQKANLSDTDLQGIIMILYSLGLREMDGRLLYPGESEEPPKDSAHVAQSPVSPLPPRRPGVGRRIAAVLFALVVGAAVILAVLHRQGYL